MSEKLKDTDRTDFVHIPPSSLAQMIWWDGVNAQRDHKVCGKDDAIKYYLEFMNRPDVIEAMKQRPTD